MHIKQFYRGLAVLVTLSLICSPAWAHVSHQHTGLWTGFTHPFSGLDHLLATFGISIWFQSRKIVVDRYMLVALGTACMVIVAVVFLLATFASLSTSSLEWLLASSVLVVGLLVLSAARLPFWSAALLAGFFIVCHAYAHVVEMPAVLLESAYAAAGYIGGFVVATGVLFFGGAITAWGFEKSLIVRGLPLAGGVLAACGLYLLGAV